ncbi:hypothetical protein Taro_050553, partial [Colocasia esculenta]|nr:hypothetical protein [Colocasia esculenta]
SGREQLHTSAKHASKGFIGLVVSAPSVEVPPAEPEAADAQGPPGTSIVLAPRHSVVPRRVNLPARSARGLRNSIPSTYQQHRATSNWVLCSWHHYTLVEEGLFDLPNCNWCSHRWLCLQIWQFSPLIFAVLTQTMRISAIVRHACTRATCPGRSATTPLQCRHFYADFVPRDPKSKPKRYKYPEVYDPYGPRPPPSDKIVQLADRIAALSPEELRQIGPTLRERLKHPKLQPISTDGLDLGPQRGGPAAKVEEKKAEKTAFDVKLEKFDAAAKIKVIKEVRAFTNLGLKEAKDLVEKTPVLLKQGVTKEEANDIIEKIKAAGGVAVME